MIEMSYVVETYSKWMDGTDCYGQSVNKYHTSIHSNISGGHFFSYTIEICIQNAWILY